MEMDKKTLKRLFVKQGLNDFFSTLEKLDIDINTEKKEYVILTNLENKVIKENRCFSEKEYFDYEQGISDIENRLLKKIDVFFTEN